MTEDAFLAALFRRLPAPAADVAVAPGDDCAALQLAPDRLLLLAVDQVVGDRHYVLTGAAPTPPEAVGRKLLARNLSDIAAMAGTARFCLVALATGPPCDTAWIDAVFTGILQLAQEYDVQMIGGDLAATPRDAVASLTVVGSVSAQRLCRRSGARAGDAVLVTGRFGDSLRSGHHLSFTPRCREGVWLGHTGAVTAMIDVSDGLLLDALRLCRMSGTALRLDPETVPRRTAQTTVRQALTDGEDYELLFSVDARRVRDVQAQWPFADVPLTHIGDMTAAAPPCVTDRDGAALFPDAAPGYDHLRAASESRARAQ